MACDCSCCRFAACSADSCSCCTCCCRPDSDTWMVAAADFEPVETTVVVDPE